MSRRDPFYMKNLMEALRYAQKHQVAIWTTIPEKMHVYHVYPGGRIVSYPYRHPRFGI